MSLPKKQHWHTRAFHPFLVDRAQTPFAWGTNDCALFSADAILANTGVDIATDFRGKYTDKRSAFLLIRSLTGGSTVADAAAYCAQKHGLVEHQHPLMAKRGDLVVVADGDELICGVVHLSGHVISVSESDTVRLPITKVVRSWSV
ncbi:DUF6950 family protein [Granulicella tundricola]|uniref:DUF6950 domain-containing protein n=1 Tax=Granulicella tundricola (strain ATCC BAA-1859 / DSM 23138 / MP5ACTX9) TaxID=1198114 RepID=E8X0S1_GRATM|nr:hypothetical protein AciX9_1976 [Granulicella tundricola MP5ACTX9]